MKKEIAQNSNDEKTRFISLRWRFISPLFIVILIIAVMGSYILARNFSGGVVVSQTNVLLKASRAVSDRAGQLYVYHRNEAQRVAFTVGVSEAARDRDVDALETILESLARINSLDSVIVTDVMGKEILGIQRVNFNDRVDFALSTDTDLSVQPIIRSVLNDAYVGSTSFMRTPGGIMLFTAVPISLGDQQVGAALVGQSLETVLVDLEASATSDLALYDGDGILLQSTFAEAINTDVLTLSEDIFHQALEAQNTIPVNEFVIQEQGYQGAYQPFNFGPSKLGVIGVLMPNNVPYMTQVGRQLTALFAATFAGVVVTLVFVGIDRLTGRVEHITNIAEALAAGEHTARTAMKPVDEVTAMGAALDQYAEVMQKKEDAIQRLLRRQRREVNHLTKVFESIPDGVIVQSKDGRVIMMNEIARKLLGSQRVFRSAGLDELAEIVGQQLGAELAPGIYSLGDPHRIHLDERVLSAQAAAILSSNDYRLGTVIILRDITDKVSEERTRDKMLQRLAYEIQQPLASMGRLGLRNESGLINAFAREITRQAVVLQRMIIDMKEISTVDPTTVERQQRPLRLETLIWAVANEWRQVARASGLNLHIIIEQKGLYVLGDEKRLRWALGNIVDNAIKYTSEGGILTLEIKRSPDDNVANIRIRDNGVGVIKEERPFLFTRFYRGTPITKDGQVIRVPGMGQGLHTAKQIFESHAGSIVIKSSHGVGTAVYITLPQTAPVELELPHFVMDMEGETVQLPESFTIDLD